MISSIIRLISILSGLGNAKPSKPLPMRESALRPGHRLRITKGEVSRIRDRIKDLEQQSSAGRAAYVPDAANVSRILLTQMALLHRRFGSAETSGPMTSQQLQSVDLLFDFCLADDTPARERFLDDISEHYCDFYQTARSHVQFSVRMSQVDLPPETDEDRALIRAKRQAQQEARAVKNEAQARFIAESRKKSQERTRAAMAIYSDATHDWRSLPSTAPAQDRPSTRRETLQSIDPADQKLFHIFATNYHEMCDDHFVATCWILAQSTCEVFTAAEFIMSFAGETALDRILAEGKRSEDYWKFKEYCTVIERWNTGFYTSRRLGSNDAYQNTPDVWQPGGSYERLLPDFLEAHETYGAPMPPKPAETLFDDFNDPAPGAEPLTSSAWNYEVDGEGALIPPGAAA